MAEEFLCVRCARHRHTCCQLSEVFVTLGDVQRIADHTGREGFFHFASPENAVYDPDDDDVTWRDVVFRSDGTRRVLRRRPGGDCTFLGPQGCTLPLDVRPLLCRIYPYDFTDQGILDELAPGCPLELLRPEQGLVEALDMNLADARAWHAQLYEEIGWERGEADARAVADFSRLQPTPRLPPALAGGTRPQSAIPAGLQPASQDVGVSRRYLSEDQARSPAEAG